MTAARLRAVRAEFERLREHTRLEIAERLREARSYGEGANNDEYHAVREEQMVMQARIATLEETIARATVVDDAEHGVAAIGSTVWIEDLPSGSPARYRLTSAHDSIGPDVISAPSPMGQALIGAVPGAVTSIVLPNGHTRNVRLVDVETPGASWDDHEAA
jgi:transcription elongation factor GreA